MNKNAAEGFVILLAISVVLIFIGVSIAVGIGWGIFATGLAIYGALFIPKR